MLIAKIAVTGVRAASTKLGTLTSGMVGAKVQFTFDSSWEGLNKTAVFRCMDITKDVLNIDSEVTIPHEVLVRSGSPLYAGVYGTNADGDLAIPTRWATVGIVYSGADPSGDTSADPSLPIWLDAIRGPKVAEVGQTIVVKAVDDNGKPTEWEAAELPAEADQPDWNAKEGEAGHILNRPFYEETVETVLFEEHTASFTANEPYQLPPPVTPIDFNPDNPLFNGTTLRIVWDGVAYDCVTVDGLAGNGKPLDIPDLGNGEPFFFDFETFYVYEGGEHTYSVSIVEEIIHKLDPKYLPSAGGMGGADWNAAEGEPGHVKNRPFYTEVKEIVVENVADATLEGFPVFAVGDTVTVKVDGVEHSLVAFEVMGCPHIGDNPEALFSGAGEFGWCIYLDVSYVYFSALEPHTVSYQGEIHHEINKKYIPNYSAFVLNLNDLIGEYSLVTNLSDGAWVYSVSPDINFSTLPSLSMCDFGRLGYAQMHTRALSYVAMKYSRIVTATENNLVLVHSDNVEQGIADYKDEYGVE